MCSDTKEKIAEAVEQMMLTKPVSKITVQSVMEQARMKRQTFYYHYQDIYSVLEWIVVREICTPLRYDESVSAEDWCMQALTLLRARQPLLRRISPALGREKLDEYDENGQQVKDKIVSFVGVAPIDDPKYVVLVALDTPAYSENSEKYTVHGMYISGGLMAAPTVRDIFLDILPYLGVEPDYGSEDIRGVNFTVPDVIGMDETEAGELLAEKTITYRVVGTGSVVTDQLPVAGSQVPGNSQIILYMGAEKQATRVEVPDFIGCSVADVNYLASNAGLYVQAKGTDRTDVYVLAAYQDIDPGTEVDRGTTITVEFSSTGASD